MTCNGCRFLRDVGTRRGLGSFQRLSFLVCVIVLIFLHRLIIRGSPLAVSNPAGNQASLLRFLIGALERPGRAPSAAP